jgi:hypothetical protein
MQLSVTAPEVDSPSGLVARPDVLLVAVTAHLEDTTPSQAVALLRGAAAALEAAVVAIHPHATLRARRLDFGRNAADKGSKGISADAALDGLLVVPLADSLDFWARAELAARVTEVLRGLSADWARRKTPARLGFRSPVPRVDDVTPYRAELTAHFATQLRALTGGAAAPTGAGWEIPDEVAQHAVSLDEVRLTLVAPRRISASREF